MNVTKWGPTSHEMPLAYVDPKMRDAAWAKSSYARGGIPDTDSREVGHLRLAFIHDRTLSLA